MRRKVVYVSFVHLSEKLERDWFIDHLIRNGALVEFWDLVPLLFGGPEGKGQVPRDYVRTVRTYGELASMLGRPENREANYVMLITYEGRFADVYRLLSKHDCRMLFIAWGALPIRHAGKSSRVVRDLFSNPLKFSRKAFDKSKALAYRVLGLVKPFEIVFAAGDAEKTGNSHAKRLVPINLIDYDHFVRVRANKAGIVQGRYVVFLDNYLPYHPDFQMVGMQLVNPHKYYSSMNRLFERVERKYGAKVVVAAHPRSEYEANPFGGREIHRGVTPELVRDSEWVISHHSTSLSYAVLNRKPVMFVYTEEMKVLYGDTIVRYLGDFASFLNASIYNADDVAADEITFRDVDVRRYDDYKYNFLTTRESENSTTRDIFWRELSAE